MLREIRRVRQIRGEPRRRWFMADTVDLIVWFDKTDTPIRFQLCYDKGFDERALTWCCDTGFTQMAVDDGEKHFGIGLKATPILIDGGVIDIDRVKRLFHANSRHLPPDITQFIAGALGSWQRDGSQISDGHAKNLPHIESRDHRLFWRHLRKRLWWKPL